MVQSALAVADRLHRAAHSGGCREGSARRPGRAAVHQPLSRHAGIAVSAVDDRVSGLGRWQHFFNLFFMIFIIRRAFRSCLITRGCTGRGIPRPAGTGFASRSRCPTDPLWTAKQDSISLPGQVGLPGLRHSIGLARWWHLGVDALWLLNGVVFYVLLFAGGRVAAAGARPAGTCSPMPLSTLIQYLSLNWPAEHGWVAYNGLQLIAYFVTVFIAAPLALITGLGMSPALSTRFRRVSKVFSIQTARSLHFLVLVWFLLFIVLHVTFVFTTGLLVNLNHVYAGRTDDSWIGFWLFAASMVCDARRLGGRDAVHAAPPPRRAAGRDRRSSDRCSTSSSTSTPSPASTARRTSRRTSGTTASTRTPTSTRRCSTATSPTTGCGSTGWSTIPSSSTSQQLRALPHHEQITQHFCIQGWSGIAKWGGVSMQTILDLVKPQPEAKWVVFYSLGEGADKGVYYDAHPIEHMSHHLTMLAYDMNDAAAPVRPRCPAATPQRDRARLQTGQMDQGHRVRRALLRNRQRLRRLQPRPRVLRLPPINLTASPGD